MLFFLTTVPARGCVRGVYVYVLPWNHASFCMDRVYMFSNATYPCLLSSSGSGPVELEHRAQLLSESEDFILRTTKKTKKKNITI